MVCCRGARLVLPIRRSLVTIGVKSWSNSRYTSTDSCVCEIESNRVTYASYTPCSIRLTVGLLRGRCVVRLLAFSRCLPSLPRSLFLIAPSLACYRGLHTVALCKSVTSSRRHVPPADKKTLSSSPHLRWAQLWRFIKSDLILLVIAVAVSPHVLYMCLCVCARCDMYLSHSICCHSSLFLPLGRHFIAQSMYLSLTTPNAFSIQPYYVYT